MTHQVTIATAQTIPESVPPPHFTVLGATMIKIASVAPARANGVLTGYSVRILDLGQSYNSR